MASKVVGPVGSRRRHWLLVVSLVVTVCSAAIFIPSALAVHDAGVFQLDGNILNTQNSTPPMPAATEDADNVCSANLRDEPSNPADPFCHPTAAMKTYLQGLSTASTRSAFVSDANGQFPSGTANDDQWTNGSKDDQEISAWKYKDAASSNDKSDIENAFAAIYVPSSGPEAGHKIIYFGGDRTSNSGSENTAFWFTQNKVAEVPNDANSGLCTINSGCPFSGSHTPAVPGPDNCLTPQGQTQGILMSGSSAGSSCTESDNGPGNPSTDPGGDVLAVSAFSIGGTQPTTTAYEWVGTGNAPKSLCVTSTCSVIQISPPEPGCDPTMQKDLVCAITNQNIQYSSCPVTNPPTPCVAGNAEPIATPWIYTEKSSDTANTGTSKCTVAANAMCPGVYFEGGLDLTALGLGGECTASFTMDTRSSASVDASLQDLAVGQLGQCGAKLVTVPHGDSTLSGVSGTATESDDAGIRVTGSGGTPPAPTGKVTFYLCGPSSTKLTSCDSSGTNEGQVDLSGASFDSGTNTYTVNSGNVTLNSSGYYCWFATWPGDAHYNSGPYSDGSATECFSVTQPTSVSTNLHQTNANGQDVVPPNNGTTITIHNGDYLTDYASVLPPSATGSVDFRYYTSSSDCTNDTTGTAGTDAGSGTVNSGSAHSNAVQFSSPGIWYFKAFFTGTGLNLNSMSGCGEVLTVNQPTKVSTLLHETDGNGNDVTPPNNGKTITVHNGSYVTDYGTVSPVVGSTPVPTGSIDFRYYTTLDGCTNDSSGTGGTDAGGGAVDSNGVAKSTPIQFNSPGTWYFKAFFTGSGLSLNSSSDCSEVLTVNQPTKVSTLLHETDANGNDVNPSNNGITITIHNGSYVTDYGTVSPVVGSTPVPTGSIDFRYYATLDGCTNDSSGTGGTDAGGGPVDSNGVAKSTPIQFNTPGVWYFKAFFTGTGSSLNSSSDCSEKLTVNQPTQVSTLLHETDAAGFDVIPSNNGITITIHNGSYVTDYGTVSPLVGSTPVPAGSIDFRYYATLDGCTNDSSGSGGIDAGGGPVDGNGVAKSTPIQFNNPGTWYFKAFFTGTGLSLNSSSDCSEKLTVNQPTQVSTLLHETDANGQDVVPSNNGKTITIHNGSYVTDYGAVSPLVGSTPVPTGSIDFRYYTTLDGCTNDSSGSGGIDAGGGPVDSNGVAKSTPIQFNFPGVWYFKAFFTGTGLSLNSISDCSEVVTVNQPTKVSTLLHETDANGQDVVPSNNGTTINIFPGSYVTDYGTVSPVVGSTPVPTGSIEFRYYATLDDCTNDTSGSGGIDAGGGPVDSNGVAMSTPILFSSTGTFYFKAFFTGTGLSLNSISDCSESVTINQLQPTMTTQQRFRPNDSATVSVVSGGGDLAGNVDFQLFVDNSNCSGTADYDSGPIDVTTGSGSGLNRTVSSNNTTEYVTSGTTFSWLVTYTSTNRAHKNVTATCNAEHSSITIDNGGTFNTP